jgi:hypothetical protein
MRGASNDLQLRSGEKFPGNELEPYRIIVSEVSLLPRAWQRSATRAVYRDMFSAAYCNTLIEVATNGCEDTIRFTSLHGGVVQSCLHMRVMLTS